MTPPAVEPIDVAAAMERSGGSFVKALGQCIRHADPGNREVLKAAFPGYWQRYAEMAAADRAVHPERYDDCIPVARPAEPQS